MTQQELDELVSEAVLEQAESLTTILEMNMEVSVNASGSGATMSATTKVNISGKQGVKEEGDNIELVSDMKMDLVMKMDMNDETLTDITNNSTIGFYYIDQTAYVNINQTMKGTSAGINIQDNLTRKTYREMSLTQVFQDYVDAIGIGDQIEMGSSFEDLIANNASFDFKVYKDGERYSIVYEFDSDQLLEQLDGVGLIEDSGISFGNLGESIGQFIVIIENDKVVDAGVNIKLDLNITVNELGAVGTGKIKLTMKARYTTDASQYPALPSDLDSYDYDQDGTFGFDDLL